MTQNRTTGMKPRSVARGHERGGTLSQRRGEGLLRDSGSKEHETDPSASEDAGRHRPGAPCGPLTSSGVVSRSLKTRQASEGRPSISTSLTCRVLASRCRETVLNGDHLSKDSGCSGFTGRLTATMHEMPTAGVKRVSPNVNEIRKRILSFPFRPDHHIRPTRERGTGNDCLAFETRPPQQPEEPLPCRLISSKRWRP